MDINTRHTSASWLRVILTMLAFMALPFLAACAQAAAPSPSSQSQGEVTDPRLKWPRTVKEEWTEKDIKYGGVFRYALPHNPPGLDITKTNSTPMLLAGQNVYSRLVRAKVDRNSDPNVLVLVPDIAERWEQSPDGMTYTFYLRKGVKWHNVPPVNGREFTADDVKWTYEFYASEKGGLQRTNAENIAKVEVLDKYTVKFTLKTYDPSFINTIGSPEVWILPHEVYEQDGNFVSKMIGTGPFIFKQFVNNVTIESVRNPNFWEKDAAGNSLPYLDMLKTLTVTDASTRTAAWRAREIETGAAPSIGGPKGIETLLQTNPDTIVTQYAPFNFYDAIWMRQDRPPYNDVRVRKAVSMCINREAINLALYGGDGLILGDGFIWSAVYDKVPTLEQLPKWYQYNPEEGKKLLAEAGYPNGFDGTFSFTRYSEIYVNDIQMTQAQLKECGVRWKLIEKDYSTNYDDAMFQRYETAMRFYIWPPFSTVDMQLFAFYHSKGAKNYVKVNDSELDRLIEAQRAERNEAKKKELWKQIYQRQADLVLYPTTVTSWSYSYWPPYVKNWRASAAAGPDHSVYRSVWLDK